ncbi:MAG: hypothetical protein HQ582_06645, partial [Planctomycetes bacterium]|nr:hypothetical protein [Planctomycetota bacterium]
MSLVRTCRAPVVSLYLLAAAFWPHPLSGAEPRAVPLEGDAAEVEVFEHFEADTFRLGATIYTNRTYTVKE